MATVTIYTRQGCEFSREAKDLLDSKDVRYQEIDVTDDPGRHDEMMRRSGRRTTPQVFIDDRHIGGASDLYKLERSGELDGLLGDSVEQPGL